MTEMARSPTDAGVAGGIPQSIGSLRFLVVDDHAFQRWATGRMLQDLGAKRVLSAEDGRQALTILDEADEPFDIVVSDLQMPGMDGMAFIRHLAAAGNAPSVILTSALDRALLNSVEAMTAAYGVAILGAIEKPVTPGKLLAAIGRHEPQRMETPATIPAAPHAEVAAALRDGAIEAFFQPKVDVMSGRVKGAEALARWRLPDGHVATPGAFLPALEAAGLADALLERMVRGSADCMRLAAAMGVDLGIAVNLSFDALADLRLGERLLALVEAEGLEPHQFVLEITESDNGTDAARALENLARLRMQGFGLSIDDCGTGYSSLQRLAHMPFTEIKIDRMFVHGAERRPEVRAILESTLQMARRLGLVAVAEGVERDEDWRLLRELRCDLAQGFLLGHPMPCAAFLEWLRMAKLRAS